MPVFWSYGQMFLMCANPVMHLHPQIRHFAQLRGNFRIQFAIIFTVK